MAFSCLLGLIWLFAPFFFSFIRTGITPGGSRGNSKPNSRPLSRSGSRHGSNLSLNSNGELKNVKKKLFCNVNENSLDFDRWWNITHSNTTSHHSNSFETITTFCRFSHENKRFNTNTIWISQSSTHKVKTSRVWAQNRTKNDSKLEIKHS